MQHRSINS